MMGVWNGGERDGGRKGVGRWWMERSVDGGWREGWDESNGRMWEEGCGGWSVNLRKKRNRKKELDEHEEFVATGCVWWS